MDGVARLFESGTGLQDKPRGKRLLRGSLKFFHNKYKPCSRTLLPECGFLVATVAVEEELKNQKEPSALKP